MRKVDLIGQRFGLIVVVKRASARTAWLGRCDCGTVKVFYSGNLKSGRSGSCGCRVPAISEALHLRHGQARGGAKTVEWVCWRSIKERCENIRSKSYPSYGGRGIRVCSRWSRSFEAFYADMGPKPSPKHSIDRRDNERGYEPGNCRWATKLEQCNNTRRNRLLTHGSETDTMAQWARRLGVDYGLLKRRLKTHGANGAVAAAISATAN